ncbi:hypothetical protein B0J17DRAFT_681734 [Rhizoctonia solani]|nr:hypothetical protein B0J17DRAFT_681734 [Rhizoctonia solani]
MPAPLEVVVHVFHHHSFYLPMEPVFDPFIPQAHMEFDSDMDSEPHLSEALTETDNDTPPETPLRATMGLDAEDNLAKCEIDQNEDSPAHFSEPLHLATPNPIRPVPYAIRSFGCTNLDEEDRGYDSEREGRPGLPRFRSFQSSNITPDKTNAKRPGLPRRAASFVVRQPGEGLSTPTLKPEFQPSHSHSPIVPLDDRQSVSNSPDWSSELPTLEEIFGHPLSPEEEAQLFSELLASPLESLDVDASPVKDRCNEATGLGLGLPTSFEDDTWRFPTMVPRQPNIESSPPECADTPGISPVLCDDLDLSPLSLPVPLVSPAMAEWSRWDVFSEVDNRILYALETGTWSEEALAGINPML